MSRKLSPNSLRRQAIASLKAGIQLATDAKDHTAVIAGANRLELIAFRLARAQSAEAASVRTIDPAKVRVVRDER